MREALFYEKKKENTIACMLCPKKCVIREGRTGLCRVRENRGGTLYALNYGACSSCSVDPMEKKPLYHFYPAHTILSFGTYGCNLRCCFCQNWEIAHGSPPVVIISPERVVEMVKAQGRRCAGVAYTYSEPVVWYEFIHNASRLVREAGFKNVLVTNGMINEGPLRELLPYIHALNIDVKSFRDEYYVKYCAGRLQPVLKAVDLARERCHVEVTTLIVTGLNDSEEELRELVAWLAGIDPDIPLHFSRYFPNFELDLPPTPLDTLYRAREIARE
ncbi:MAG: AmmeMemoRadiSam system radical SAM enzyme, partial [Firmicutes bacterium]|nr:AmmeMemoRadiSam system radical SAM enzyme [Bacillota bacterium]